jgi:hypothetical protein
MLANRHFQNATQPLDIPTYDGGNQCVHPDVISVKGSFYGCEYLMVLEPYPFGDERLENPSLFSSNDGFSWRVPPGITNPIVGMPACGWNSDADLLNTGDGRLFLYYRYNSGAGETALFYMENAGGTEWSNPVALFTVATSGNFASPAAFVLNGKFHLLYVDTIRCEIKMLQSIDGKNWKNDCNVLSFPNAWHLDALAIDNTIYLLVNDKRSLFLLRSDDLVRWWIYDDSGNASWRLLEQTSAPTAILNPSANGWDNDFLYRGSLLLEHNLLRLWYSARSATSVWRVGYCDAHV